MTKFDNDPSALQKMNLAGVHPGIATQLRELYQAVQDEEIPDRFLSLLEKLEQAEKQAESSVRVKDSAL
ncbi:NepR family anti-sigma factor [Rhizobium sp. CAU 1783]